MIVDSCATVLIPWYFTYLVSEAINSRLLEQLKLVLRKDCITTFSQLHHFIRFYLDMTPLCTLQFFFKNPSILESLKPGQIGSQ